MQFQFRSEQTHSHVNVGEFDVHIHIFIYIHGRIHQQKLRNYTYKNLISRKNIPLLFQR